MIYHQYAHILAVTRDNAVITHHDKPFMGRYVQLMERHSYGKEAIQ
jgi:hypothetical protein